MAFSLKAWKNKGEGTSTPLSAGALNDLETRLSAFSETLVAGAFVTAEKLATGAVTAVKIGAEAVETAKIKGEAVTAEKIANLAVTAAKINVGAVTEEKIGNSAVTTAKINAKAVTDAKLEKPIIIGSISSSGTITRGTGFTVAQETTAVYTIILTEELATAGIITVTCIEGSEGTVATVSTASKKEFIVKTLGLSSGAFVAKQAPFTFHIKPL